MPRPSKLWKRAGREDWHATIGGRKVNLGPDREAAQLEFHRLKSSNKPVDRRSMPVAVLVDLFLEAASTEVKATTHANYVWYLQQWVNFAGTRPAAGLKPLDLTAWLRARARWNPNTRRLAVELIRRWGRWCKTQGYLDHDVFDNVRAPRPVPRKAAHPSDIERFLAAISCPLLRDIATVLLDTGARPGEIRTLTADQIDWEASTAQVEGKMGQRVISLTSRSLGILHGLASSGLYPTGPLFRNRAGRIWTKSQLCYRFRTLSQRLGVRVIPYAFRHDLWRRCSKSGVDSVIIAKVLGHKDLKMLVERYAHVDTSQTKEAVEKAAGNL